MPREYQYLLLDVFTEHPLQGNQLAVFLNAEGLSDEEMQALARETNLSETAFCFPTAEGGIDAGQGVPVRIFTTEEELPFAGHPTLGAATALRITVPGLQDAAEIRLKLRVGTVPVRFAATASVADAASIDRGAAAFGVPVFGEMEQPLPVFGTMHDRPTMADLLGLAQEDIDTEKPVQTVSTGVAFCVVVLRTSGALGRMHLDARAAGAYLATSDAKFLYVLAPDAAGGAAGAEWQARMQFYGGEDAATGSAAGAATAYLVHHGYAPAARPLRIRQGMAIARPSFLHTSAVLRAAREKSSATPWEPGSYVRVGGSTVLVAEGRFFLS